MRLPESGASMTTEHIDPLLPVIGEKTRPIYEQLAGFARSRVTILLRGASGTGKSKLAHWVHRRSTRFDRPFIEADLHGGPSGLTASTLLGHRRGAFTGATETRRGRLAEAHGGTLFIDEVDKLDLGEQALLLRVLERRSFREVGGDTLTADARLIVGTNANLEREVRARRFREDLYYRINAVPVFLPTLDERADEIIPWALYMLGELHAEYMDGAEPTSPHLTPGAQLLLQSQRWPGNLRQLRHVVERAYLLARSDGAPTRVSVSEHHVDLALLLDRPDQLRKRADLPHPLVEQLEHAARISAQLILKRAEEGREPLPATLWEGFAGLVVDALRHIRPLDRESAVMLGLGSQVPGGNYHKTLQRLQLRGHQLLGVLLSKPPDDRPIAGE